MKFDFVSLDDISAYFSQSDDSESIASNQSATQQLIDNVSSHFLFAQWYRLSDYFLFSFTAGQINWS
jgi:hypothetical protein